MRLRRMGAREAMGLLEPWEIVLVIAALGYVLVFFLA